MAKYKRLKEYDTLQVPLNVIYFDKEFNCRGTFTPQSCIELAESIKSNGLKMPILLQPADETSGLPEGFEYRIVAGHRRYTAVRYLLGWQSIPATVIRGLTEEDARVLNLIENVERKDLSFYEEAMAMRRAFHPDMPLSQVATAMGKSQAWCDVRLKLFSMPQAVIEAAKSGELGSAELNLLIKHKGERLALLAQLQLAKAHGMSTEKFARKAKLKKKAKNRSEISKMLTYLWGEGLVPTAYKALAWAAGDLTDEELLQDC